MILLRLSISGLAIFLLIMIVIGVILGSSKAYELPQKTGKSIKRKKVKEKKVKEEAPVINPDVVEALQSLGFKKQESVRAAQVAIKELGNAEPGALIKEALKQL